MEQIDLIHEHNCSLRQIKLPNNSTVFYWVNMHKIRNRPFHHFPSLPCRDQFQCLQWWRFSSQCESQRSLLSLSATQLWSKVKYRRGRTDHRVVQRSRKPVCPAETYSLLSIFAACARLCVNPIRPSRISSIWDCTVPFGLTAFGQSATDQWMSLMMWGAGALSALFKPT